MTEKIVVMRRQRPTVKVVVGGMVNGLYLPAFCNLLKRQTNSSQDQSGGVIQLGSGKGKE